MSHMLIKQLYSIEKLLKRFLNTDIVLVLKKMANLCQFSSILVPFLVTKDPYSNNKYSKSGLSCFKAYHFHTVIGC